MGYEVASPPRQAMMQIDLKNSLTDTLCLIFKGECFSRNLVPSPIGKKKGQPIQKNKEIKDIG
jgi:hypothetical protein